MVPFLIRIAWKWADFTSFIAIVDKHRVWFAFTFLSCLLSNLKTFKIIYFKFMRTLMYFYLTEFLTPVSKIEITSIITIKHSIHYENERM